MSTPSGAAAVARPAGGPGADSEVHVDIVIDVANVMGSRPDGWWRDRAAAALRLVRGVAALSGRQVDGPDGAAVRLARVIAVVEGQARAVPGVDGVDLVRASADGDRAVVQTCETIVAGGGRPLAVTADRGLRARLPDGTVVAGPRWLLGLLE